MALVINEASIHVAYCDLMEEIKIRHALVRDAVGRAKRVVFLLSPFIIGEVCFLQLRMICELIALGCLLIHGDVPATRTNRMKKAYRADWIISVLGEIHTSFYPQPGEQIHDQNGKVIEVISITTAYLTRNELVKLYTLCHSKLHRGSLKTVKDARSFDFAQITVWLDKIRKLLNHHQIPIIDDEHQIWVVMNADTDGRVHSSVMKRVADQQA
jgi:hypothetical protein